MPKPQMTQEEKDAAAAKAKERMERYAALQASRMEELRQVAATYPFSIDRPWRFHYGVGNEGLIWLQRKFGDGDSEEWIDLFSPVGAIAWLQKSDQEEATGLRLRLKAADGNPKTIDVDRAATDAALLPIVNRLAEAGLRIASPIEAQHDGVVTLKQMLRFAKPERTIQIVNRTGFHVGLKGCSNPVFICPNGVALGCPDGVEIELAEHLRLAPDVARGGTLEGWTAAIDAAVAVDNCPHLIIGAIAGLCGPLIDLAGLDTVGINLSGFSSHGKTTAQRQAASSWSTPDVTRGGLMHSAKTTLNALEHLARRSSATVTVLDELRHLDGDETASLIHIIAGGVGKSRMTEKIQLRATAWWRTFAMLSCESTLREKVGSGRGAWTAGLAVRFPDISVEGINNRVTREEFQAIDGITANYGWAGPAFVAALIRDNVHKDPAKLREAINAVAARLAGADAAGPLIRAAIPFAVLSLAAAAAQAHGLITRSDKIALAIDWAWKQFRKSGDAEVLTPEDQIVGNLKRWIMERWDISIVSVGDEFRRSRENAGWRDDKAIYLPRATLREAAGVNLSETAIAKMLNEKGLLIKKRSHILHVQYVPKVGRFDAFALSRDFGKTDKGEGYDELSRAEAAEASADAAAGVSAND